MKFFMYSGLSGTKSQTNIDNTIGGSTMNIKSEVKSRIGKSTRETGGPIVKTGPTAGQNRSRNFTGSESARFQEARRQLQGRL